MECKNEGTFSRSYPRSKENVVNSVVALYGKESLQEMWSGWIDTLTKIYTDRNGDLCKTSLPQIKCPTLIVHGKKDQFVFIISRVAFSYGKASLSAQTEHIQSFHQSHYSGPARRAPES